MIGPPPRATERTDIEAICEDLIGVREEAGKGQRDEGRREEG